MEGNGGDMKTFLKWVKGIIGAAIGGAANSIAMMGIKPEVFNFSDGIGNLGAAALSGAIIAAALHLAKSPIWEDK